MELMKTSIIEMLKNIESAEEFLNEVSFNQFIEILTTSKKPLYISFLAISVLITPKSSISFKLKSIFLGSNEL